MHAAVPTTVVPDDDRADDHVSDACADDDNMHVSRRPNRALQLLRSTQHQGAVRLQVIKDDVPDLDLGTGTPTVSEGTPTALQSFVSRGKAATTIRCLWAAVLAAGLALLLTLPAKQPHSALLDAAVSSESVSPLRSPPPSPVEQLSHEFTWPHPSEPASAPTQPPLTPPPGAPSPTVPLAAHPLTTPQAQRSPPQQPLPRLPPQTKKPKPKRSKKKRPLPPPQPPPHPPPQSPPPPPPQPPPQPPALPARTWEHWRGRNCWWSGHGSEEVDAPDGSAVPGVANLEACKGACLASSLCEGIVVPSSPADEASSFLCYRKRQIEPARCDETPDFDLHTVYRAWPPRAPTPPNEPTPPLVEALNGRFAAGRPDSNVEQAGVLVHQDDEQEGATMWEASWGRMAATVVNAQVPYMYSTSAMGLVLSAALVQAAGVVRCSYWTDGNSMAASDLGCANNYGSMEWGGAGLEATMRSQRQQLRWKDWCLGGAPAINGAGRPPSTEDRSGCQYNEVVLDGNEWTAHLPQIVAAVFYPINGHVDAIEGDAVRARSAHDAFTATYGLSSVDFAPLLTYDVAAARSGVMPWAVAP